MALSSDDIPNCRIAVVGDSGTGKTSLIHLACYNTLPSAFIRTFGCRIDGKMHVHTRSGTRVFIEFVDVGSQRCHAKTRHMFYRNINGVIMLYDMTNRRSHARLRTWFNEIMAGYEEVPRAVCIDAGGDRQQQHSSWPATVDLTEFSQADSSRLLPPPFPILLTGTHRDLLQTRENNNEQFLAPEITGGAVEMNLTNVAELQPGSNAGNMFNNYLDRVCERVSNLGQMNYKNYYGAGALPAAQPYVPLNTNLLHQYYPLNHQQQMEGNASPQLRQRTSSFGPLSPKMPRSAAILISSRLGTAPSCVVDSALWHSTYAIPPLLQPTFTYTNAASRNNVTLSGGDAATEIL